jgi:predicted MFS family arabinose efflux permease
MKVIWFVNLAIFIAFAKIFEVPSMIPVLVDDLQITYAQAGIFMTAYTIVRCLASLPAGSISDRWGGAPVILVCLICVGLAGILATLGSNYYFLLSMRVMVSLGIAIIFIAAVGAIPKYVPPEHVGKNIGYINGSLSLGIALALFMTPILVELIDWRWTARLYSISFVALFLFYLPLFKNIPEINKAESTNQDNSSISIGRLLGNLPVMLLAMASFIIFIELYGVMTWIPVFLEEVYLFSPAETGISATMLGVIAIPASIITGRFCTSVNRITAFCVSGGIFAGTGILILLNSSQLSVTLTILTITLITWGHTQVLVPIMSLGSLIVPSHSTGKVLGLIFTFAYAGSILPTYLGGYLLVKTGNHDASFTLFAAAAFLSIFAMLAVSKVLHKNPPSHFKLKTS